MNATSVGVVLEEHAPNHVDFILRINSMDLIRPTRLLPSIVQPAKFELKPLPADLKYAYLEKNEKLPVIVAKDLQPDQEERLLLILRQKKKAIGWSVADIPGISPSMCMHQVLLEKGAKP